MKNETKKESASEPCEAGVKKPYKAPSFRFEPVFEVAALACGKVPSAPPVPSDSYIFEQSCRASPAAILQRLCTIEYRPQNSSEEKPTHGLSPFLRRAASDSPGKKSD